MTANDFGGGSPYLSVTIGNGVKFGGIFGWAQPSFSYSGGSGAQNSFAVYLLDNTGAVVASATDNNVGGDALQNLDFTNSTANTAFRVVVVQNGGTVPAGQLFKLVLNNGQGTINGPNANKGSGALTGHEALLGENVLASVDVANTPVFGNAAVIETSSSVGPGKLLYDGSGNLLATAIVPNEPQFAAPDGTNTNSSNGKGGFGFTPFFGTSAAAPAAGAATALVLQVNGSLSTTQVTSVLAQSVIPASSTTGFNGAGLIQARAAVEISAADAGARRTNAAGGNWNTAGAWSGNATPTTAQAASLDDNLGAFAAKYTVTVNTGGDVAGSLAIAAPAGSGSTLTIASGGNLAVGGSSAANPTANELLVSDNGTLNVNGGRLGVAGSLNVNNGTVAITSGAATAADYSQNAGQITLGGGSTSSLTINGTGFNETGGTATIAALGTLTTNSLACSAANFSISALSGLVIDTGAASFVGKAIVSDAGVFQGAGAVSFTQSTLTDTGSFTDTGTLSFDDTATTVSSTGSITAATLNIGYTLVGYAFTLTDAGTVIDTGNFGRGTSIAGGVVALQTGGTLSIGGTSFIDDTITFAGNGLLKYASTDANTLTNLLQSTISGLAANNGAVDFTGLTYNSADTFSYLPGNGQFDLFDPSGTSIATVFLDKAGNYAPGFRLQSDGAANHLEVVVICFASGTRLQTSRGEVPVQDLRAGDVAVTHRHSRGVSGRIAWIGQRRINVTVHPHPERVRPVRFDTGSLGNGLPWNPMVVSPDHGMFLDGVLVPARLLINGVSIMSLDVPAVTYFHVELERHAILLAHGVPSESYLDTGNRAQFGNASGAVSLHADFARGEHPQACAPLATDEAIVRPLWERFAALAGVLHASQTDRDPGLTLVLPNGRTVTPEPIGSGGRHVFNLHGTQTSGLARLRSRNAVPSDVRPWLDDRRRLGVGTPTSRMRNIGRGRWGCRYGQIYNSNPPLNEGFVAPP